MVGTLNPGALELISLVLLGKRLAKWGISFPEQTALPWFWLLSAELLTPAGSRPGVGHLPSAIYKKMLIPPCDVL